MEYRETDTSETILGTAVLKMKRQKLPIMKRLKELRTTYNKNDKSAYL